MTCLIDLNQCYFVSAFLIFIYMPTVESENDKATSFLQPDIKSSSLTGAFRPAEIEMRYNTSEGNSVNSQQFVQYMVSIRRIENSENFGHRHFCGGTIIRSDLILTAAHCFVRNGKTMSPLTVVVVAKTPFRLRKTSKTEVIKVKKIIIHEDFLYSINSVDLAILKLKKDINLEQHFAAVINLPTERVKDYSNCVVLGWGKLYLHGPMANEILQINVTLHSDEFCKMFFKNFSGSKVCASDIFDIGKNPCSGDSGGPLICNDVLTGIVSYGADCGLGIPTVYTDVYKQRNWIIKNKSTTATFSHFVLYSALRAFILLEKIINYLCD